MERIKKFRKKSRPTRDVTRSYFTGKCHICQLHNLRVSNLNCNKHNYCQLCASFVPRFIKGDYSCKMCAIGKPTHTSAKTSLYRVMDDLEIDNSLIRIETTTGDSSPCEEFDNADLDGNNEELDKLLAPFITHDEPPKQVENLEPILKQRSFLHLTLPSANSEKELRPVKDNSMGKLAFNNYINGLIQRSRDHQSTNEMFAQTPSPPFSPMKMSQPLLSRPRHESPKLKVSGKFQMNPDELERGSSPCKGLRPRSCDSSQFEEDNLLDMIGQFDGPDLTSDSSSHSSLSSNSDHPLISKPGEFWGE